MIKLNSKVLVDPAEIVWIEGHVNYSKVIFRNQKPIMLAVTLKKVEELLNAYNFYRINRSTLINLDFVTLGSSMDYVNMNGKIINTSRRRVEGFKKVMSVGHKYHLML